MMFRRTLNRSLLICLVSLGLPASAAAQTNVPAQTKQPRAETSAISAPQVVTIVHRLNGLKMFRLLLRSERQLEAIANLDETFSLLEDVHTNAVSGLAMDDGQTV